MGQTYQGVDVDHPRIVEGIQNLARQGMEPERIMEIIGMPMEVVRKHMRVVEKEKDKS